MPESPTENPEFAGQCLLRIATVSAALTGGGIFLLTDWTMGILFRIATALCLAAFAIAAAGLTKRPGEGGSVAQVESRWRWFSASVAALFAALSCALVGIFLR